MNVAKLRSTTALATVILTLATIGAVLAGAGLLVPIFAKDLGPERSTMLINTSLALVSKVGLLATGVALLKHNSRTARVAVVALGLSLLSSLHDAAMLPVLTVLRSNTQIFWPGVGALIGCVGSIFIYAYVLYHLRRPKVRIEFGLDLATRRSARVF